MADTHSPQDPLAKTSRGAIWGFTGLLTDVRPNDVDAVKARANVGAGA